MLHRILRSRWTVALGVLIVVAAAIGACGGSGSEDSSTKGSSSKGASSGSGASSGQGGMGGMGGSIGLTTGNGGSEDVLDVEPSALQTITVAAGQTTPTVTYKATLNGMPTNVSWTVDRGDLATIPQGPASTGVLSPTGTTGGLLNVIASQNSKTITRQVFIQLTAGPQNGANASSPAEASQIVAAGTSTSPANLIGGGGVGGVGGEGLGPAVSNFPTTVMPAAMGLTFLYPYDKTVWPRGMLAPLLMWDWAPEDADAIKISLSTTSGSFSYTGTFGRPAVLGTPITGMPAGQTAPSTFIRHPIPQDVWTMATNTAGGPTPNGMPDQLTVDLWVAKGGVAYGPITETWTVAPASLTGTLYYNSYGTALVQNSTDHDIYGNQYGAAVLGITAGATAPVVVAGPPSGLDGDGCRVCHMVSMDGSTLTAVHGNDYQTLSAYSLENGNAENVLTGNNGVFDWAGLYPDASLALTNTAEMGDSARQPVSQLFAFPPAGPNATPLTVTGLPSDFQAGVPAWSPDGTHVAFELLAGTIGSLTGTSTGQSQLAVLDFDKATMSFTNPRVLATMPGGGTNGGGGGKNAGFPSFFPTNDAVVFHNQLVPDGAHRYDTWHGAEAQVWWSDLGTGTATVLGTLNGLNGTTSYLPTNANHADDTVLNYEPTVNPVVTGGYAWVVFTSRRLYGNLATIDPSTSDPRDYDYLEYSNVTCKKLWVAAVDIGTLQNGMFVEGDPPGSDPSHPAFYLPAQELVAGNSRGFWVLEPCKADGMSCASGDQCCNGYCEPNGSNGALVCGMQMGTTCSGLQDKCTTAADCCDTNALCINGFCALGQQVQ